MSQSLIIPGSGPFFFPGGRTGCILIHGFTAMPEETRPLGEFLAEKGLTVLGLRLAGHATHPLDLRRTHWQDWLADVETGLAFLSATCDRIFLIGQSMGGMIALTAATRYPVAGVVGVSTPAGPVQPTGSFGFAIHSFIRPSIFKKSYDPSLPLGDRREAEYPAYPWFPTRILGELYKLRYAMDLSLPEVTVPTLVIQSRDDQAIPPDSAEYIHNRITSAQKSIVWMDKAGHSILLSENRRLAFEAILSFIEQNYK